MVVAVAVALAALPAGAAAKGGHFVEPASLSFQAHLPKSHGFSLQLLASNSGEVQLLGRKRSVTVSYSTQGRVTGDRIRARFARFGAIDLRFKGGAPKPGTRASGCKGKAPLVRKGVLTGELRLRGKRGSIMVASHRARASSTRSFRLVCKESGGSGAGVAGGLLRDQLEAKVEPEEELMVDALNAVAFTGHRLISFTAIRLSGPIPAALVVNALVVERLGRVSVVELVAPRSGIAAVSFSPEGTEPETVTAAPPSPFAGKATYSHTAGSPATWTGSLRVRLPGSGWVHLTGDAFEAEVCHSPLDELPSACGGQ